MGERVRKWYAVLVVAAAVLAPSAARAQEPFGVPWPQVQTGPGGITIIPMPGVLPAIRVPAVFGEVPREAPQESPPEAVPEPAWEPPAGSGRTAGVFVGITDYPSHSDLPFCASDAVRVQQAFVGAGILDPMDTVVLTDRQATRRAVIGAIEHMSRRLGPGDTLVFFFSGHGDRVSDGDGDERDGLDETIVLVDGSITDDELTALFARGAQRELVALDSCYSGGFARDVARLHDSAGFYASREDQVSYVAEEHQAGGYLSFFLAQAVGQSGGRPLAMWELQGELARSFASSRAAGRQDLTVGMSRGVNTQTVLFARDRADEPIAHRGRARRDLRRAAHRSSASA